MIRLCDLQAMQKNMRETIDNLPEGQAQVIRWRYYDRLTLAGDWREAWLL